MLEDMPRRWWWLPRARLAELERTGIDPDEAIRKIRAEVAAPLVALERLREQLVNLLIEIGGLTDCEETQDQIEGLAVRAERLFDVVAGQLEGER